MEATVGIDTATEQRIQELIARAEQATAHQDLDALARTADELDGVAATLSGEDATHLRAMTSRYRGNLHLLRGQNPQAETHYKAALALFEAVGDEPGIARTSGNLGVVYNQRSDFPEALKWFQRSLDISERTTDAAGIARTTLNIGTLHKVLGDYDKAIAAFRRSMEINESMGNGAGVAHACSNIGTVHVSRAEYAEALEWFRRALDTFTEIGDRIGMARNTGNIGSVYSTTADYPHALEWLQKALQQATEIGDRAAAMTAATNIGNVYQATEDYDRALEWYGRARTICEEIGAKAELATITGNTGKVHHKLENDDQALVWLYQSLDLCTELELNHTWVNFAIPCISVLIRQNRVHEAQEMLERAETKAKELNARKELVDLWLSRAELLRSMDRTSEALSILRSALNDAVQLGLHAEQVSMNRMLYEIYYDAEQYKEALDHYRALSEVRDSISGEQQQRRIAILEVEQRMAEERARSAEQERLLYSILPPPIAERLLRGERLIADTYDSVSILFLDIVGFTTTASTMEASELVHMLNGVFAVCDAIMSKHGLTKIKTIGDAYLAVCGAPEIVDDHVQRTADCASEILTTLMRTNSLRFRVGLHCGPVVAGVIGTERVAYDVWGDAVNVASRMEHTGEPGRIHVSQAFAFALDPRLHGYTPDPGAVVADSLTTVRYNLTPRGEIEVKGKGLMRTFWMEAR
jgi:class 3 adenylate cyclase/Tfp pilus assembly protein PilF